MITQKGNKQDQRYRHLDDVPMPVLIASGEHLVVEYANRKALCLIQNQSGNAKGRQLHEVLPTVFSSEAVKEIYCKSVLEGTRLWFNEKQVIVSDSEKPKLLWYNVETNPMIDDEGRPLGVIVFLSDVTDQLITKRFLGQRDDYLGNFFREAPVGLVCYRGLEFIVDFANDRALEMWGTRLDEVVGKRIDEIFPEVKTNPKISALHSESLERLKRGETRILTFLRDGVRRTEWIAGSKAPGKGSCFSVWLPC